MTRMRKIACLSAIVALAALGLVVVAVSGADWYADPLDELLDVALLGTVLGETSVVALWSALGPGALARRLPLAAVWLALIIRVYGSSRTFLPVSEIDPVS